MELSAGSAVCLTRRHTFVLVSTQVEKVQIYENNKRKGLNLGLEYMGLPLLIFGALIKMSEKVAPNLHKKQGQTAIFLTVEEGSEKSEDKFGSLNESCNFAVA